MVLLTAASTPAWSLDDRSSWSVAVEAGRAFPVGPADFTDKYNDGSVVGARVKKDVTDHWSLGGAFASQSLKGSSDLSQKITTQPLLFLASFYPFRSYRWNPYFTAGAGVSRNKRVVFSIDEHWTKLSGAAGLGVEFHLTPVVTAGLEGLYRYYTGASKGDKDFQTASLAAVINFYIPESWVPEKPRKPLAMPEAASTTETPRDDTSQGERAQQEFNNLRQAVTQGRVPPITFKQGTTDLADTSYQALDMAGAILNRYALFSVRVEVHTDEAGPGAESLALSQQQAETVRTYLVQKFSVPGDLLTAVGMGDTQPADTPSLNRRVEFVVIK